MDPLMATSSLYVRAEADDYVAAFNAINSVFESPLILHRDGESKNEIAFITPSMREKEARTAISKLPIKTELILRVMDY